ncbi:MAG: DNA mismatch repair endonuclease MutL [Lachnospiraceae bacterium]|nr:DNA mismatch repair endonuclease MutL [Lachnospiraceae bacterium]
MPIRVLDSATIDKIAAGEVVERPSSVVKELVENAIDAGATHVTVEVKEGGTELIRVTDNGCGIEETDLRNAFLRHSTSKITSAEDLAHIRSLGFRGEALSSICAVSQLEIITKPQKPLTGIRMAMEGGRETLYEEIGAPQGTTILVRNLFFNTPARRKFLKTSMTEGGYICDLMERIALSHPEVSFQLTLNGKTRFHTSGSGDLKEVIYRVYGRETSAAVIPIDREKSGIRITGYLGTPELVRSNRNMEIYFLNGRFIRSDIVAKAIEEGYREYLMIHKFPVCFLNLHVDPARVDVNVHPTKMDVRISDQNLFFSVLSEAVFETLKAREMIPGQVLRTDRERKADERQALAEVRSGRNPEPFQRAVREEPRYAAAQTAQSNGRPKVALRPEVAGRPIVAWRPEVAGTPQVSQETPVSRTSQVSQEAPVSQVSQIPQIPKPDPTFFADFEKPEAEVAVPQDRAEVMKSDPVAIRTQTEPEIPRPEPEKPVKPVQQSLFDGEEGRLLSAKSRPDYRFIGQVFDTYWIIQYQQKLLIIDQHAAHEKVNYERMMKRFREKTVSSQQLLPPVVLSLTGREETALKEHLEAFEHLGFEIEHFGGSEYALRAVPTDLYGHTSRELFLEVLEELSEGNSRGSYAAIEEKVASMACKASVKGGDRLSVMEAQVLIDELLTLENPYNCPHGRPTVIAMSEYELEKKFKRIVD